MIDPKDVHSPRDRWTLIDVLAELGGPDSNWWALALGHWDDIPCLAARWNGDAEIEGSKGNPISRGYPTWFILPDEMAEAMKSLIPAAKRNLVDSILATAKKSRF
jgi:hypothetical protein